METIGIDIGFGYSKAVYKKQRLIFKSILGDAANLQFWSDFEDVSPSDQFHVTIDERSYFVGELAEYQSNVRHFTLNQDKLLSNFVKVLALTAAGILLEDDASVNLVSGLPVAYFKDKRGTFNDILKGTHDLAFTKPDGTIVTKKLKIDNICMMPQPMGSAMNLVLNDRGELIEKDLIKKKIGIIDIGFRTTDIIILDQLQYVERGSRTLDTGISKAFGVIANKLREKSNTSIELFRLYQAVAAGSIKIKGQEYNFSTIRDQVYTRLAEMIAGEVDRLWADDWDMDKILFTGGGCTELARLLTPLITGNLIPIKDKEDARMNNVLGYIKYGKRLWPEKTA